MKISLPESFKKWGLEVLEYQVEAISVLDALKNLEGREEKLAGKLLNENQDIKNFVLVFLDGKDIRMMDGKNTKLDKNSELLISVAISGG